MSSTATAPCLVHRWPLLGQAGGRNVILYSIQVSPHASFLNKKSTFFSQCTHHTTPHHITSRHVTSHHITVWNIVVQCQSQPCPVTFIVSRNQLGRLNIPTITRLDVSFHWQNSTLQCKLCTVNQMFTYLNITSVHCIALFTSIKFSECNNFYDLCCSIFIFMIYSLKHIIFYKTVSSFLSPAVGRHIAIF